MAKPWMAPSSTLQAPKHFLPETLKQEAILVVPSCFNGRNLSGRKVVWLYSSMVDLNVCSVEAEHRVSHTQDKGSTTEQQPQLLGLSVVLFPEAEPHVAQASLKLSM